MYMYAGITHSVEVVLYMYKVSKQQCFLLTYLGCWCKRNRGNWNAICNRVRGCIILCTHIQNEKIMTQSMISSCSVAFQLKLWRCSMAVELKSELNTAKCITYIPHVMGPSDQVASLWQILSLVVVFSSYPLLSSQTKHALEPGVTPV